MTINRLNVNPNRLKLRYKLKVSIYQRDDHSDFYILYASNSPEIFSEEGVSKYLEVTVHHLNAPNDTAQYKLSAIIDTDPDRAAPFKVLYKDRAKVNLPILVVEDRWCL